MPARKRNPERMPKTVIRLFKKGAKDDLSMFGGGHSAVHRAKILLRSPTALALGRQLDAYVEKRLLSEQDAEAILNHIIYAATVSAKKPEAEKLRQAVASRDRRSFEEITGRMLFTAVSSGFAFGSQIIVIKKNPGEEPKIAILEKEKK